MTDQISSYNYIVANKMTFISYQTLPLSIHTELSNKPMQPSFFYISNSKTNFVNFSTHENLNISTLLFLVDRFHLVPCQRTRKLKETVTNANRTFPIITSSTEDERLIPTIKQCVDIALWDYIVV